MKDKTESALSFQEFIIQNMSSVIMSTEKSEQERLEFIGEYPLERIQDLQPEEYCLGTDNSKDSLSYSLEFGKYKSTGFGVGGGSANKHGIYYSKKEQSYMHKSKPIDIDSVWTSFANALFCFLVDGGQGHWINDLGENSLLQGMSMILTKLLCLYYPDKFISMGSPRVMKGIMDHFHYKYNDDMKTHELNFELCKNIKSDYSELNGISGLVIGTLLWDYADKELGLVNHIEKPKGEGLGDASIEETHYWMYSPGQNASKWDEFSSKGIMAIGWGDIGDLSLFDSQTAMQQAMKDIYGSDKSYKMDSLATWQFAYELKPGDVVYAKRGRSRIIGRGVVASDYYYMSDIDDEYKNIRDVDWKDIGEWDHPGMAAMKTLTDVSAYTDYVQRLDELFITEDDEENTIEEERDWPSYDKEDFLSEVFMDESSYDTLVGLIEAKKNVILQGAPGVGKTYAAKRLAYSIMGEMNLNRVMMVQFHQSYSYEDFIEGFRPSSEGTGFEIKKGSFYNFCKKATDDKDNKYFFIIDEINRGNLSKIFGELFMLIENDKRGNSLNLLYSDEKFFVPQNVYIIGMMNTADRSLALLDYALRRRFSFFEMAPALEQQGFVDYKLKLNSTKFNSLIDCVKRLNDFITADASLGDGFRIGHSYFCGLDTVTDAKLSNIVEYELIPLLKEYWFDDPTTVRDWTEKLRSSIR